MREKFGYNELVQPQSMFDFVRVYISLESFLTFATTLFTMCLASLARRSFLKSGIQFNGKINLATRVDSRMHHQFTGSSQGGACAAALLSVPRSPTTSEVVPPGYSKSAHTLALSGTELAKATSRLDALNEIMAQLVDDHRTSQAAAGPACSELLEMLVGARAIYPLPANSSLALQKRHLLQYLEVSPLPV
ncbi:hypothetical protein CPB85DRAFT_1529106 [Mucidula mucida]|nr:hypothetical protein CPB85DRAFT_1529106 [Mucidula mucida]